MNYFLKLFLLFSSALNVVLLGSFIYLKYVKFPTYYRDTVKLVSNENPEEAAVILLGDSFISKYDWPVLSSAIKIANFGLGGSEIRNLNERKKEYLSINADTIVIWAGINDLVNGRHIDSLIADFQNLTSMLKNQGRIIYCITVLPLKTDQLIKDQSVNNQITRFNNFLKLNYKTIDLFEDREPNLISQIYDEDGLHLNAVGYRIADVNLTRNLFCEKP